jgi:hypothetical protein
MRDVVVRLGEEKARHLFERCTESTNAPKINGYSCEDCREIGETLRAAIDSPPVEGAVQHQIYAETVGGGELIARCVDLDQARQRLLGHQAESGLVNPRIQSRTTTQLSDGSELISPWSDLESEEGRDA